MTTIVERTEHPRGGSAVPMFTAAQARRTAIAAQRLASRPRDGAAPLNLGHLRRLMDAVGLLQIDSVNVLARAHYLPVFSRLGPYPTELLDRAAWPAKSSDRVLYESWAHVASLVPVQVEPLLRWKRFKHEAWLDHHPSLVSDVLDLLRERGPMSAGQIEKELQAPGPGRTGWWEWSDTKRTCEHLLITGALGVAYRRAFERHYDLIENVVPATVLAQPTPTERDAKRALVALAARHHGVGTAADLADYYRLKVGETKTALTDLVEDGVVRQVRVEGWRDLGYLYPDVAAPRAVHGQALLCPFDPLIFDRARTERLFGVRYRIGIYTPAAQREHGYYVFLLLIGDRIGARLDLKSDRSGGRLLVQSAWSEPGVDPGTAAPAAAQELNRMASWLGLPAIAVADRGDLAGAVRGAVGALDR